MARKQLTDAGVAALKPKATRYAHPDPGLAGHYVRVTPAGTKTFVVVTRSPEGKQIWKKIGPTDALTVQQARDKARDTSTGSGPVCPPARPLLLAL